jgi:membrane-bound lytic murein transglycosylase D
VAIAEANKVERTAALEPGAKLIIPATQAASETRRRLVSYRVRRGDTLAGIADRFSVNAEDVRKWNRLRSNRVGRGMVLRIYTFGGAPEVHPSRSRSRSRKKASAAAAAKPTTTLEAGHSN